MDLLEDQLKAHRKKTNEGNEDGKQTRPEARIDYSKLSMEEYLAIQEHEDSQSGKPSTEIVREMRLQQATDEIRKLDSKDKATERLFAEIDKYEALTSKKDASTDERLEVFETPDLQLSIALVALGQRDFYSLSKWQSLSKSIEELEGKEKHPCREESLRHLRAIQRGYAIGKLRFEQNEYAIGSWSEFLKLPDIKMLLDNARQANESTTAPTALDKVKANLEGDIDDGEPTLLERTKTELRGNNDSDPTLLQQMKSKLKAEGVGQSN